MHIEIVHGDITKCSVDAIVNAANTSLLGGGGVDGAIHRAGGKNILNECMKIRNRQGGCKVGESVITSAGLLNAKYVIHTVGPRFNNYKSNEREKLKNCYLSSIRLLLDKGLRSIAFPCISTGIYRFPKDEAAELALEAVRNFEEEDIDITFVCFESESFNIYLKLVTGIV